MCVLVRIALILQLKIRTLLHKRVIVMIFRRLDALFDLILQCVYMRIYEPRHEKTNVLVSDLVRHKPGFTATEDG